MLQPMLLKIVNLIESSLLQTVPNFLAALLQSHDPKLHPVASAIKSPTRMNKILRLMTMYQSEGMMENWALELSQRIYVNEIKTVIQKGHSLHFNAHSATADDVTNFSLENMIDKFRHITPKTWVLVQKLLDANGDVQWCAKPPKEVANYQKWHDSNIDLEADDDGVEQDTSESESESGSGGKGKDGSSRAKRWNAALLRVVSEE